MPTAQYVYYANTLSNATFTWVPTTAPPAPPAPPPRFIREPLDLKVGHWYRCECGPDWPNTSYDDKRGFRCVITERNERDSIVHVWFEDGTTFYAFDFWMKPI